MFRIQGNYCENCAIRKIKYWYLKDEPKFNHLFCVDCGRYRDQQTENNLLLQNLEINDPLKEIQRRMKGTNN